jgi:TonB family protein
MDAVSEVLVARSRTADGLNSMVGVSVMAHLVVLAVVVFVPADWWGVQQKEPENVLQVSLGGPIGPRDGGLNPLGSRAIQQAVAVDAKRPIEPVRPPAAKQPDMVEPTTKPPVKTTPNKVDAKDPRSRTPTKGAEVHKGTAVADTKGQQGTGLSAGGGGFGGYVDAVNFCCPEYLAAMKDFIIRNWDSRQQAAGIPLMRFVIQKDGRIVDVSVEKSSGNQSLDYLASRALSLTKLPPLPAAYGESALTVHLYFEYQR